MSNDCQNNKCAKYEKEHNVLLHSTQNRRENTTKKGSRANINNIKSTEVTLD
jgi:hypothetical protein